MSVWIHFYGNAKAMRVTGFHQCRLMSFAERHRGWHTINPRDQFRANNLAKKGYLEVLGDQFKFKYPEDLLS